MSDAQRVMVWPLQEMQAFERTLEGDPETSSRSPVLSITQVTEGESVRRTSFGIGRAHYFGATSELLQLLAGRPGITAAAGLEPPG